MTNPFTNVRLFFDETVSELKKSSWPTKHELRESTMVVFFTIVLLGVFIMLCDLSVFNWVTFLTKVLHAG